MIRLEGMRKLIMDLLDLTRIESGQKKRDPGAGGRVRRWPPRCWRPTRPWRPSAGHPGCRPPPAPCCMQADAGELEIIFNNLVSNAIKYNQDGGSVTVEVEDGPDQVAIAVTRHRHRHDRRGDGQAVRGVQPDQEREDPQHPGLGPGAVDPAPAGGRSTAAR